MSRLEIAAQMMAAMVANSATRGVTPEILAKKALECADSLLSAYHDSEPNPFARRGKNPIPDAGADAKAYARGEY